MHKTSMVAKKGRAGVKWEKSATILGPRANFSVINTSGVWAMAEAGVGGVRGESKAGTSQANPSINHLVMDK